ncbi:MAG: dipeptide epimerase [Chthonomonadaceae bacterium]|nr:dipeptide epimerase [Chthonomonadaceae bacterium]
MTSSHLKITEIEIYRFGVKMIAPFRIATMVADHAPNMLVCIRTDAGLSGWGEGSPLHSIAGETQAICLTAAQELKPLLLGRNPLEIVDLVREMEHFLPHNATTRSAFDMALHDIAAQAAGMPLYRYLGGATRTMETDLTMGLCPPEAAGAKAREVVAQGFRIIKIKLGTTYEADVARVRNIREAVGPEIALRLDANQGWDRVTALRALNTMAAFDVEFCEQPLRAHDVAGMRMLQQQAAIPVMADESLFSPADALRLITEEAAPYFNIKLSKSGGIHNALKIATLAEASGVRCMVGCMLESRLGLTAAAHFACAAPTVQFFDLDTFVEQAEDPIAGGMQVIEGRIQLPETPGLGAVPTPEALALLERLG